MRRILLDTDLAMGTSGSDIDDGFALALALADPELSVEMVTTVTGNTDVDTATELTVDLLKRLGRHPEIPVVRGAARSLHGWVRQDMPVRAGEGPPAMSGTQPGYAAFHLIDKVLAEPGELTIVAIGPLTNVALALAVEPALAQSVREIVVMGGTFLRSRNSAAMPAEFNTYTDPDATAIVLASGAPLRFVGLDVTTRVRLGAEQIAALRASGGSFAEYAAGCAEGWIEQLRRDNPGDLDGHGSCALHDPLAVAVVSRPDLVTWRPAHVAVETGSSLTRGVMVADLLASKSPPLRNCEIAVDVDSAAFLELFLGRVSAL